MDQDKVSAARRFVQENNSRFPVPDRSYVVMMSPRSGSHLLTTHLQSIGYGNPFEAFHFNHESMRRRYGWEIDFNDPAAYLRKAIDSQIVDGVFGTKVSWSQYQTFLKTARQLTDPCDPSLTDPELIEVFFPNARFICMKRRTKVRQAVSYSKAMQTGIWLVKTDQDESFKDYVMPPEYDREHIEGCLEELLAYDVVWENYLRRNGIDYLEVWYEGLAGDFVNKMRQIYHHLGIENQDLPEPAVKKLANVKSQEWVERFKAETSWLKDKTIVEALETGDFLTAFIHRGLMVVFEKEQRRWHAMPVNRFKPVKKFFFRVRRKLSSYLN